MASEKGKPGENDLSAKIVTDPANPPDAVLLVGIQGASSEAGHTRLYFDPQFSNYIDIPDSALLYSQDIPAQQSPFGQSYVWVKREALQRRERGASREQASFLEGAIAQAYLGAAAGGAAAPAYTPATLSVWCPTVGPACWPTQFHCPAHTPACPQIAFPAPTVYIWCPTVGPACWPTHFHCPPHTPACPQVAAGGGGPNVAPTLSVWCPTMGPACMPTHFHCPPHTPACPQIAATAVTCPTAPQVCLHTAFIVCHHTPFCPLPTLTCPIQTGVCPRPTLACPQLTVNCPWPSAGGCVPGGGVPGGGGAPGIEAAPQANLAPTLSVWCPTLGPACWPTAFHCPIHTPHCPM